MVKATEILNFFIVVTNSKSHWKNIYQLIPGTAGQEAVFRWEETYAWL